ncbi:M48 family metallopeptidase [Algirhabdus cladophorae]|uniref:M48 family metallopeptidase n=1 Tax=Algirhabdus cladophorae TaxID=3377108 RepID=UPI003B846891
MDLRDAPATFFDGETALKQDVVLTVRGQDLEISDVDGGLIEAWPLTKLRRVRDTGTRRATVLYLLNDDREARLSLPRIEDVVALKTHARQLDARPSAWPQFRKIALWTGAAVAAVVLMIFVIIPSLSNQLAATIPPAREEAIGKTVLAQIERFWSTDVEGGDWTCETPDGQAALETMTQRMLGSFEIPYDLKVAVVKHDMINAFALPGGHVVIMSGLLDKADAAEEVAGVLAHELGHVANRDPMRLALRAAGSAGILSLVLGDATGGAAIAIMADQLVSASHTRDAEADADVFALERMSEANISPEAFAGFFDKLRAEYGDTPKALALFASHPDLAGRADAARLQMRLDQRFDKVLSATEWQALKGICDGV